MATHILGERYEIQQLLGKRAGRRTLLARDLTTQDLVVIKLLSFGSDFEWENLKLFEREAETLKALSHPAIPRYLDFFELDSPNDKGFALVQTYVEGKSLEEQLKTGRTLSEAELKQFAKALLEILIYLHGRQPPVIHRDIKPSNILLTNRSGHSVGEVYLVDFGSVQTMVATEGRSLTVVGTYGYMPPEQFGGRTVPASDIYSLGATLIYLVTGTHPADLPQKDGRIQFEQATNLSREFAAWLKWMTQPSLDKRLSSANEALQALEQPQQPESASLVVRKPANSRISLTKNADSLEIITSPPGYSFSVGVASFFAIVMSLWLVVNLSREFNFVSLLFSLLYGSPIVSMVYLVLMSLFGRVRFRIDQQKISKTSEVLGFKYNRFCPALRQDITKLEYRGRSFTTDTQGNRVENYPQIVIWAGVQKCGFGGSLTTEPELEWLAYELSEWLGLPITRE